MERDREIELSEFRNWVSDACYNRYNHSGPFGAFRCALLRNKASKQSCVRLLRKTLYSQSYTTVSDDTYGTD